MEVKTISYRMPTSLHKGLRKLAIDKGLPFATLCNEALKEYYYNEMRWQENGKQEGS